MKTYTVSLLGDAWHEQTIEARNIKAAEKKAYELCQLQSDADPISYTDIEDWKIWDIKEVQFKDLQKKSKGI